MEADDEETVALAKAKCLYRCPVTEQCLSWVLSLTDDADPGGMVGGFTEAERRGLRFVIRDAVTSENISESASDLREYGIRECQTRLPEWIGAA
jgi:hypothetical protein